MTPATESTFIFLGIGFFFSIIGTLLSNSKGYHFFFSILAMLTLIVITSGYELTYQYNVFRFFEPFIYIWLLAYLFAKEGAYRVAKLLFCYALVFGVAMVIDFHVMMGILNPTIWMAVLVFLSTISGWSLMYLVENGTSYVFRREPDYFCYDR